MPIDDYELPLGSAEVLQKGSDLTLLTWGTPVYQCETALSLLSSPPPSLESLVPTSLRGASIELIDLRTILPWDMETIVRSVEKTGRLVVVHEASQTGGVGAEISAEVQKRCFLKLKAPVKRITAWECVSTSSKSLSMIDLLIINFFQRARSIVIREVHHPRSHQNLGRCHGYIIVLSRRQ